MSKIRIGIVGGGFNGQIGFIQNFDKNKYCKIYGLAEARTKLRKKLIKKFKIENSYSSHKDLIKDIKKYDGIAIITRRDMIGPLAFEFLKLGKPVLTEKPMAGNYDQAEKLLKCSKKYKTLYKIGYNKIYDEGIVKAKRVFDKIVKKKSLGKIVLIKLHRLSGSGYDNNNIYIKSSEKNYISKPSWPIKPKWLPKRYKKSYEKYLNLYCHNVNLLRYFINETPKILNTKLSDKTMSVVNLQFRDYCAVLETGHFTKYGWDETFEIYFELGCMKIFLPPQHYKNRSAYFEIYNRKSGKIIKFKSSKSWSFRNQCNAFIDDISKKRININRAEDGLKDIKLIEDIWKNYINT